MAEDRFTKEDAEQTAKTVEEMFNAIPKARRMEYIGHLNDIFLFLDAAKRNAPSKSEPKSD